MEQRTLIPEITMHIPDCDMELAELVGDPNVYSLQLRFDHRSAHITWWAEHESQKNSVCGDVWHGLAAELDACQRGLAWTVDGAEALADQLAPLYARFLAGWSEEWDGSNHVGRTTEDAAEAWAAIEAVLEDWDPADHVVMWDTAEWMESSSDDVISAGMTPDAQAAYADELRDEAEMESPPVYLVGVDEWIAEAVAEADEAAAEEEE